MLDVHPPHHAVSTWRDFLIHIATIVIGLLIAIALEQTVEWFHHRHIVARARENIRHEIEQNEAQTKVNRGYVRDDEALMMQDLEAARKLRLTSHGTLRSNFSWSSFNNSAWTSARDSGALTYMPVDEVRGYTGVYDDQDLVNKQAITLFTQQIEMVAPMLMEEDTSKISQEDVHAIMLAAAISNIHLRTLGQMIEQLDAQYVAVLKQ